MKLDDAIHKIVDNHIFRGLVDIERVGEGRYRIESRLVFIRVYSLEISFMFNCIYIYIYYQND